MTLTHKLTQLLVTTFVFGVGFLIAWSPAHAQEQTTVASVALSTRIPAQGRTTPGSVHVVSTTAVAAADVGGTCDVSVTGANNESVHPNSDILVESANTVTIHDVERVAGADGLPADGELALDDAVTVSVRLGEDGLFSGGTLVVAFSCTSPPPPTTTTTAPPQTTIPTTPTTIVGPPMSPVTRCVENPDTTALECGLPNTGARSGVDVLVGVIFLAVGVGAFFAGRGWVHDRRRS